MRVFSQSLIPVIPLLFNPAMFCFDFVFRFIESWFPSSRAVCFATSLRIRNMMESNHSEVLIGSKALFKKHEFVRIIVQCLYSLGYSKSASCLEVESGVLFKSKEFQLLESHVLNGNWDGCIGFLNSMRDIMGEAVESALFLALRQCLMEYIKHGEVTLALDVLRKRVSALHLDRYKVHSLANSMLSLKDTEIGGAVDGDAVRDLRRKLLTDLEKLLPPPILIPDGRLEHLVETTVTAWVDSCLYHNSSNPISLYEDHRCGRDQIPTTTTQVSWVCRV